MKADQKGRYFSSKKQYLLVRGRHAREDRPCIHVSGSIKGIRKQSWGYSRDIVRIGSYYYLQ